MGGNKTGIGWTDESYQITEGCMHAGTPACDHCYAEEFASRFAEEGQPYHGLVQIRANGQPRWTGVYRERPDRLLKMIGWRGQKGLGRRTRVFIGSMTDTFHEKVSDKFLAAAFAVFAALGDTHTIQLLTKRPGRARAFFDWLLREAAIAAEVVGLSPLRWSSMTPEQIDVGVTRVLLGKAAAVLGEKAVAQISARLVKLYGRLTIGPWPLRNVWLGATVENEEASHRRVLDLVACPAWLHWLSMEPLFESFHLGLPGILPGDTFPGYIPLSARIRWIVLGLESGNRARPGHLEHLADFVEQCELVGIDPFVKQLGSRPHLGGRPIKLRHPHGSDISEFPPNLRVQRFPPDY